MSAAGRNKILLFAAVSEILFCVVYGIYIYYGDEQFIGVPTLDEIFLGTLLALPLLLGNYLLFGPPADKLKFLKGCQIFRNSYVTPLIDELDLKSAMIVSLLAGLGEELFFRGVIQDYFGLVIASVSFALVHFGTAFVKHRLVTVIYILVGFYLGLIFQHTSSLWTVIIVHTVYDFLAIILFKNLKQHELINTDSSAD